MEREDLKTFTQLLKIDFKTIRIEERSNKKFFLKEGSNHGSVPINGDSRPIVTNQHVENEKQRPRGP